MLKFALVNPERLWPRFAHAVGRLDLTKDARFADAGARRAHAQELIAILDAIFATEDAAHWKARLEAHDIPFAVLPTYDEVARDPQMRANGMLVDFDHPRFGRLVTVDSPISVAGVPKAPPRAAPDLGQHTREVLTGLGYTDPQIRDFLGRGVAVQG